MTKRRKIFSALAGLALLAGLSGCASSISAGTTVAKEVTLPDGRVVTCVYGTESISCDWEHVKSGE